MIKGMLYLVTKLLLLQYFDFFPSPFFWKKDLNYVFEGLIFLASVERIMLGALKNRVLYSRVMSQKHEPQKLGSNFKAESNMRHIN